MLGQNCIRDVEGWCAIGMGNELHGRLCIITIIVEVGPHAQYAYANTTPQVIPPATSRQPPLHTNFPPLPTPSALWPPTKASTKCSQYGHPPKPARAVGSGLRFTAIADAQPLPCHRNTNIHTCMGATRLGRHLCSSIYSATSEYVCLTESQTG